MLRPDRRLFTAASVLLAVVAALHTLGHLAGPPPDPAYRELASHMQRTRADLGLGMRPSAWDVSRSLSLTMSVTLLWLAAQNLTVAAFDQAGLLLRPIAALSALGLAALIAIYAWYQIPPPLLLLAVVEVVFLAFLVTTSVGPRGT